jgi:hypothetical protein
MESTFWISDQELPRLTTLLTRAKRRADKLGVAPITASETGRERAELVKVTTPGHPQYGMVIGERVYREYVINGEAPRIHGWALLARVEHVGERNFVQAVPGVDVPVSAFTSDPVCEHCNTKRRRKDTFLVRHDTNGLIMQVGSTCLRDFLGHDSPEKIVAMATYVTKGVCDLADEFDDWQDEYYGLRPHDLVNVEVMLSTVSACIRVYGWVSRGRAYEHNTISSVDTAAEYIFAKKASDLKPFEKDGFKVTDADVGRAAKALEWMRTADMPPTSYFQNLKSAALLGAVTFRSMGILASGIVAYERATEQAKKGAGQGRTYAAGHAAPVKARKVFKGEVVALRHGSGTYGPYTLLKIHADTGHCLAWFATADWAHDVQVGDALEFKATVKRHSEYRGVDETELTRGALVTRNGK